MWRAWTEGGADRPAALFLHGWLMDHYDEKAAFDGAFAQAGFARLYCDLPVMGNSHAVPVPHDLDGFLDALAAFSGWSRASFAVLDAAGHEWPLSHQKPLLDALVDDFLRRVEDAG
ncbi:MAG: hypothetical protein Q4G24_09680 [Paracoccus sp. (in: a-proteobacteria)]|uniref:alpha/beta fold hydrolase n=1 Tax=Paracoccus sp. TaxID=267 RepID=UPI0026DED49D|nr:hypothetical protein [Paracoccus sp. (in: a-proteobacteria)]MDO5621727.1 hypothetical protein [Paracoccus sp. (in: a-proteobacteria)]